MPRAVDLTPRQLAHIKAALILWEESSRHSRVSPSELPRFKGWFSSESPPLAWPEVEVLLKALTDGGEEWIPLESVAFEVGCSVQSIVRALDSLGIESRIPHRSPALYRSSDLDPVREIMRFRRSVYDLPQAASGDFPGSGRPTG